MVILAALAVTGRPARAGLFEDIMGSGSKKKPAVAQGAAVERRFRFIVYLTTGDILKAVEFKGKGSRQKGNFRFISNFESDIEVRTSFIKYIDLDNVGEQALEEEYVSAKSDRIYLRNADYLTGKIIGFTAKDVLITTTYGDLKAAVPQVRYMMFRNPSTTPEHPALPQSSSKAPTPPAPAASESPAPDAEK